MWLLAIRTLPSDNSSVRPQNRDDLYQSRAMTFHGQKADIPKCVCIVNG